MVEPEWMPGDAEAAGAVAGMQEFYGRAPEPSLGQWVSGVCCGRRFSGEVLELRDGLVVVGLDGATLEVPASVCEW